MTAIKAFGLLPGLLAFAIGAAADLADIGLTATEEKEFWYTGQGSMLLPAAWWRHLEQAESDASDLAYFKAPEYIEAIGYLARGVDQDYNPNGYPVGFADSKNPFTEEIWMGHSCAACHSNELIVNGTPLFVTGAPTLANFDIFQQRLIGALDSTYQENDKFDRFAERVLAGSATRESKQALRAKLMEVLLYLKEFQWTNRTSVPGGYGRVDAFGIIYNQTSVKLLGIPENRQDPDAPVSYPFLWGAAQGDFTQWNGVADNDYPVFGPLARNVTEVMGVYGLVDVKPGKFAYQSSIDFPRLQRLEELIEKIRSPHYPDALLAAEHRIDAEAALRGKVKFESVCGHCHQVIDRADEGDPYKVNLIPIDVVGTDRELLNNSVNAEIDPGKLAGELEMMMVGPRITNPAPTFAVAVRIALGAVLAQAGQILDPATVLELMAKMPGHIKNKGLLQENPRMHLKARPLNGIWATAPFLHNGSVPNLTEFMKAPDDRVRAFFVGCREYDPVNIGFKQPPATAMAPVLAAHGLEQYLPTLSDYASDDCDIDETSLFLTHDDAGNPMKGNSNEGHDFPARFFTWEERMDIREFLKTL